MATPVTHSEKLNLRLTPAARQMLYRAAESMQRSLSEFVLESALARAEETLAGRRYFGLNAEQWEAFMAALDAPAHQHARLESLLQKPSILESTPQVPGPA